MAKRVVIDVVAQFKDETQGVQKVSKNLDNLEKAGKRARKSISDLSRTKASPKIDANSSKFEQRMKKSEDRARNFGRSKFETLISVRDRATEYIEKAAGKAKDFAGRSYDAFLRVKNSDAMHGIAEVGGSLKTIAGRAWQITVSLADKVTAPVRRLVSSLNSVLGLAGMGLSSYGLIIKPVSMQVEYQDLLTQFEVLLGSKDKAQQRIDDLTSFAGDTPFTRDVLYKASRILEVYTGGALSTPDSEGGMKMVGDIAAGTGSDYLSVATWTGRLYSAMKGGRAVGEMTAALQEMGALSAEARNRIEALADSGRDISQTWPEVTKEFARFDDIMKKQSDNLGNLLLGVKSFVTNNVLKRIGTGISDELTPFLKKFRQWRSDNKELIAGWADSIELFASKVAGKALGAVEKLAAKVSDIMESDQFEEADGFWGKAKVMWDKIIAEPLSEWWNGPGKSKVVDTAGKIGMFLGEGITAAVLTIFGIKTDLLGEGMNIGASFIDGFVQGFRGEEVASAIWEGMSNFFSSHPLASLILGGAGLSRLSGGLTPVLAPIVGAGKGIYKALKSDTAGKIGTSVIGSLIGTSAQTGGGRVVTGGLMKGASLSAGTASGLGMAATAGGIMAGATVISGATDLYKGYNADNEYDKKHSYIKGGVKLGGAGAGAAIGTAILPGVGTLIGAGIGGLAGWLSGGKLADSILGTKKNLDKYGTSSSEAARRLEELDEKQAALAESTLNRKFGDIALSADEVSKAVDGLFNPQQTARINSADTALNQLTSSFANLQEADMMLKKDLWMASVKDGAKLTSDEIANLKSSIKTYDETSKQYITDSQYAAHESTVALLGNSKAARDIINSTDKYYKDQQSKLSGYQSELSAALNKALSDGRIDINEEESLNTIRTKIAEITNEIANEEYLADMEVLKLNLEGDIDWKSFQSVMKEAYDGAKARLDALDKDYGYSASSITKGEGTKAEKETAIKILQWGDNGKGGVGNGTERGLYKEKVDIALEVENLGIDKIKDKFGQELGILGDDISEIMKNGPNKSMREALLALSNDGDTVAAISRMLKAMEPNTSELHRLEEAYREAGLVPPKAFREGLKQVDFLEAITNGTSAALEWLNDPDNRLTYKVGYETEEFDSSDVNVPDLVLNPSALVDPVYRFLNYDPSELIPPPTVLSPPTTVQPKYQYVQFNTGNLIPGITTLYPTINVNPQYNVLGKPPGFSYRGGIYGTPGFAEGGYVQGGSQLITVAEEGTPEAIIPLGKHRRKRAMELFNQVGGYLGAPGFASKGFAAGGIAGGTIQGSSGGSTEPVKVDVGGIAINIKAEDGQGLVDSIRGNENEIAEVIAGVLNRALKGKFANTPAKGEA